MSTYLLDTNVFIQAKNLYYGLDFCPGFWDWLKAGHQTGRVFSVEKVAEEINAGNDELSDWIRQIPREFFLKPDQMMLTAMGEVSTWVMGQGYEPSAINMFLQSGDYYLISHALAHHHTVVTHEVPAPTRKRIKIPNVCIGLNIRYTNSYGMLRQEKARFILETQTSLPEKR